MRISDLFRDSRGAMVSPTVALGRTVRKAWLQPVTGAGRALIAALADGSDDDVSACATHADSVVTTARAVVTRAANVDAARANGHASDDASDAIQ